MKHLFSQFVKDSRNFEEELSLAKSEKKEMEMLIDKDSKIPSI
jgi:hypothetical protein